METKPLSDLQIDSDFIFMLVMQQKAICKELAEILLNIKIRDIVYETQKTKRPFYYSKSVRFDVYIEDSDKVINIEMQSSHYDNLPLRARYYQGMLDATILSAGQDYSELRDTYLLFICKDDPFKAAEPIYTQQIICRENSSVDLTNGANTKYFNCSAYDKVENVELRAFMEYVSTYKPTNKFTKTLDDIIIKEKAKGDTMKNYEGFNTLERDARQAGIKIGIMAQKEQDDKVIAQLKAKDDKVIAQLKAKLMAYENKYAKV